MAQEVIKELQATMKLFDSASSFHGILALDSTLSFSYNFYIHAHWILSPDDIRPTFMHFLVKTTKTQGRNFLLTVISDLTVSA